MASAAEHPSADSSHGVAGRHHLASVADVFLSGSDSGRMVCVAAPGAADTGGTLAALIGGQGAVRGHDLGSAVGVRLARWERDASLLELGRSCPDLFWCPRGPEGLSLVASLALGRLAALLRPDRLTVFWYGPGRACEAPPGPASCRRAHKLAAAAVPRAMIRLHCLGWLGDADEDLAAIVRQGR